ncbi:hypothetical protein I3843_16G104100 [Carya illinoinensis]|nr:hypothetical protein I3843_16G104100 [Carya illinoinensis]KAG7942469.1 hypothetical protein I3843_16G104100 [Carya illinoinensis]
MMGQGKGTPSRVASQGKQKKVGGLAHEEGRKNPPFTSLFICHLLMLESWRGWQQERSMERLATWKSETCFISLIRKFLEKTGSLGLYFGFSGHRRNPMSQVQSSQLVLFFLILFCFFPY